MKKLFLIAAMACGALAANAQTLSLSTYNGTDIAKFDGTTRNVSVSRYLFTGWNTISLPFAMSAQQVNETFGYDCKLETLVGVENDGTQIKLNFQDCKAEGIKANTPYILYFTGESCSKTFRVENAALKAAPAAVSFTNTYGVKVTFACAQTQREGKGLYGILAKDNGEATFVNVDGINSGFYATRCYVELSNGNSTLLTTNHLAAGETTSVNTVLSSSEKADVYNLSGAKVASGLNAKCVSNLPAGIYVVKGKKVLVK